MPAADPIMLATARQARGLTQTELARKAGLSQAFSARLRRLRLSLTATGCNESPTCCAIRCRCCACRRRPLARVSVRVSPQAQHPSS